MSDFVTVASLDDVPDGTVLGVSVGDAELVLIRQGEVVHALEDRCSHEDYPLSAGEVAGDQITCMLHGARFDLATGAPKALPAVQPVKAYEVRIEGDDVQVRLQE
jgi:3-phenylpropionate/trans-cinnamate dioxygenase ferredoxin subunit